jgi:pyridoxal biosynthesis lyase PdxS
MQASAVSICCPEKSRSSLELSYRALIESVQTAVETPVIVQVMAVSDLEASIIEALDVDMVHEIGDYRCTSCVDAKYKDFPVPVVCASSSLWPLLQRFTAGASMICTQKEGSLMATLAQLRLIKREFQNITTLSQEDINSFAEVCNFLK